MTTFGKPTIILAAGGNPTAIFSVPDERNRRRYVQTAKNFLQKNKKIEQVGFLEKNRHLEMSGGEFCGNATRAAALMIYHRSKRRNGAFTVSGFPETVRYHILPRQVVLCTFPRFPFQKRRVKVFGNVPATMVDLGGIVHIVLPPRIQFENLPKKFRRAHREIMRQLHLARRPAIGVIWQEKTQRITKIHPIIWVPSVKSFFYETSCGSGTIATLLAGTRKSAHIIQPSGEEIFVARNAANTHVLRSRMEHVSSQTKKA